MLIFCRQSLDLSINPFLMSFNTLYFVFLALRTPVQGCPRFYINEQLSSGYIFLQLSETHAHTHTRTHTHTHTHRHTHTLTPTLTLTHTRVYDKVMQVTNNWLSLYGQITLYISAVRANSNRKHLGGIKMRFLGELMLLHDPTARW